MANNPFEEGNEGRKELTVSKWSPTMIELIQQEVNKILKGKQTVESEQVNFAQVADFTGNIS